MFCENCGMEIENARFCPGCGAEQKSIVTPTSIPVQAAPMPEAPEGASIPAASVPVSAPISSAPAAAIPTAPAAPQPSAVPNPEQTAPVMPTSVPMGAPMGVSSSPTVVVVDESSKRTPARKYTGGHIALCLITAAVMAGVAGVFAGLYFSLLWAIS